MSRSTGAIRMAIACALLFGSMSLVVWRQSRALEELRALDAVRAQRAVLQSELAELQRTVQYLESRSRIVAVAGERLGLRTPTRSEIVFLQLPSYAAADDANDQSTWRGLLTAVERR